MAKNSPSFSTPGRKKLESLNMTIPVIPLTSAGGFPKSNELIEFREKVAQGVLNPAELRRKERIATDLWLRDQARLGLDVHVDGEMDRGSSLEFFADRIGGFARGGLVRVFENHYFRKPIIKDKLAWKGPIMVEAWQLNQRATNRPLKAVIAGPYTLLDWSFDEYYSSREEALNDLTQILRKEVASLAEAGAKIIQIDEPAISGKPHEFDLFAKCLTELTKGLKSYFILRHAYGNWDGIWNQAKKLPVDNFYVDGFNSNFSFLNTLKKSPTEKDVTIGILDSLSPAKESPAAIHGAVKSALKVMKPEQLWLAPDAGLHYLTIEQATRKMETLVAVGQKARKSL